MNLLQGALGTALYWLQDMTCGQILGTLRYIGSLGYALVCFLNAAWRIVAKADDQSIR